MECCMPGFSVLHYLLEFAQIHVHWVSDDIQPFHLLSPSAPLAFNLSQHQGLFQLVWSLHQVAKVLELQLQHQSFQWIFGLISFRMDWLDLLAVQETLKVFSSTTIQQHQFFGAQPCLRPTLTSVRDHSALIIFMNMAGPCMFCFVLFFSQGDWRIKIFECMSIQMSSSVKVSDFWFLFSNKALTYLSYLGI